MYCDSTKEFSNQTYIKLHENLHGLLVQHKCILKDR